VWHDYADLPPFRRCEAASFGLTDADVRRLLASGVLIRLGYGLLAGRCRDEFAIEDPEVVALGVAAMRRRYPSAVAGYRTAGALHRLWLVGRTGPTHLLRERGYPRRKHDVVVDTVSLPDGHVVAVEGVLATSVVRTAADLMACLPGGQALAIADSALRAGVTRGELLRLAAELGYDASSGAARVLAQADALSQGALESLSRWLFHVARLPRPELQVLISDEAGAFALVDFLWREQGVIGESDGLLKYDENPAALRNEKLRQERLERLGYTVVRWGFTDATAFPDRTVARVQSALARSSRGWGWNVAGT
jgi:hypothetical protein